MKANRNNYRQRKEYRRYKSVRYLLRALFRIRVPQFSAYVTSQSAYLPGSIQRVSAL
jgi:hypothetical protein